MMKGHGVLELPILDGGFTRMEAAGFYNRNGQPEAPTMVPGNIRASQAVL